MGRRRPGAIVEDEFLVPGAYRERRPDFGGHVGLGDMAAFLPGEIEVTELVDVEDEQGTVVVEDVEDLETEPSLVVPKVWDTVEAVYLEPKLGAPVLLRSQGDAKWGRNGQVAASLRLAGCLCLHA